MNRPLVEQMDEVAALVKQRGEVYGPPEVDFGYVAQMVGPLQNCPDRVLRHVLYMIVVKIVRLITTPSHADSWLDIVGYARTAAMIIDRRNKKGSADGRETAP